jgi:hypothetical protein
MPRLMGTTPWVLTVAALIIAEGALFMNRQVCAGEWGSGMIYGVVLPAAFIYEWLRHPPGPEREALDRMMVLVMVLFGALALY